MNKFNQKFIAPILVTALIILYYVLYFLLLITLLPGFWQIVFGIVPFVLSVLMVKICMERIHEIRKGEEDDLGKY